MGMTERAIFNSVRLLAFAKTHPEIDSLDFDAVIDLLLKQAGF
jgi:hypothetical protein